MLQESLICLNREMDSRPAPRLCKALLSLLVGPHQGCSSCTKAVTLSVRLWGEDQGLMLLCQISGTHLGS